jgi:hypothetical protein
MSSPKEYRAPVSGGDECMRAPRVAVFTIDEAKARNIFALAVIAKVHDLYKVQKFDYGADYLQFDPQVDEEDATEQGEENSVRTECDCLNVSRNDFWFSAYIKHTDSRVECEQQSIRELAQHFGLAVEIGS